ncbi:hypothetical protein [Cupriavidus sp. AcVe19-6a]|uniref:hypothetical protein n=1 Tax=Cupriavidus sp. AcVe19-6a TaxID=2821358 RepID=UPI001AE11374|nr:hypothetical protein [Cupriavidus sp. AcVe19-6a]MBP0638009.1 hypothetical protein [Cupriavidus sp. AcVe19-6a]
MSKKGKYSKNGKVVVYKPSEALPAAGGSAGLVTDALAGTLRTDIQGYDQTRRLLEDLSRDAN